MCFAGYLDTINVLQMLGNRIYVTHRIDISEQKKDLVHQLGTGKFSVTQLSMQF